MMSKKKYELTPEEEAELEQEIERTRLYLETVRMFSPGGEEYELHMKLARTAARSRIIARRKRREAKAARIAELEAERDHFREVAEKLVWLYSDEHQERLDNGLRIDGFYSHEWLGMILDMAREAMKGAEK